MWKYFVAICRMIKIEHSIFALPFAFAGAFMAAGAIPQWETLALLTVAMVAIRSYAMTFNRIADLKFDRLNPRTQKRQLVTREIKPWHAWIFCLVMVAIFFTACYYMNEACFTIAFVAFFVATVYSLLKRFTWICHFCLGAVLGLAPIAGWFSVDPVLTAPALLFFLGVVFWVAGFDILYSTQDMAFDKRIGLHSVPAHFGLTEALLISTFCHVNTIIFFFMAGWTAELGWAWYPVWALVSIILLVEHSLISAQDMSRVNMAFFTMNGIVSVVVLVGVLLGIYIATPEIVWPEITWPELSLPTITFPN